MKEGSVRKKFILFVGRLLISFLFGNHNKSDTMSSDSVIINIKVQRVELDASITILSAKLI